MSTSVKGLAPVESTAVSTERQSTTARRHAVSAVGVRPAEGSQWRRLMATELVG
jgi:hypothetical protein